MGVQVRCLAVMSEAKRMPDAGQGASRRPNDGRGERKSNVGGAREGEVGVWCVSVCE